MTSGSPVHPPRQVDQWQVIALEIAVIDALKRAGSWLLGKSGRAVRGQLRHIPQYQIHTQLQVPDDRIDDVMQGALTGLHTAVPDADCLHDLVEDYVRGLLISGHPHDRSYLEKALAHTNCDVVA